MRGMLPYNRDSNIKDKLNSFARLAYKVFIYLVIIFLVVFGIYKIIKWDAIFNNDIAYGEESSENINLPPAAATFNLSYKDKVWLNDFISRLNKSGKEVTNLSQSTSSIYYIDIEINNKIILKVDLDSNVNDVWKNFAALYASDKFKSELALGIDYIDLRFGNRIYYMPHNVVKVSTSTIENKSSSTTSAATSSDPNIVTSSNASSTNN